MFWTFYLDSYVQIIVSISNRNWYTTINLKCKINLGVPQGSLSGPLLFTIHFLPLDNIFSKFHINFHRNADDNQFYSSSKLTNDLSSSSLTNCITQIKSCFSSNFLQPNIDKTEIPLASTRSTVSKTDSFLPIMKN